MFEFNKRETLNRDDELPLPDEAESGPGKQETAVKATQSGRGAGRGEAAVIGPSIHINGDLHGEEDLIIEGEVKGTVHLKNNSLTIGSHGKVRLAASPLSTVRRLGEGRWGSALMACS